MKVETLHDFDLSPSEAGRLQKELAPGIVEGPALDLAGIKYVAGADVSEFGLLELRRVSFTPAA